MPENWFKRFIYHNAGFVFRCHTKNNQWYKKNYLKSVKV